MGKGIVKLGEGKWAVKDGNLLAAKETNGRFKNTEFTVSRGTRASYVGRDGLIKESNLQDVNLVNNGDFSELGSELVVNGTFDADSDWSTIGTWDIVNNQAEAIGNGISQYIQQDFTISNGNIYKFTYEIIENTLNGNGASLSSSGGFGSVSISNVVGTHTEYITASNDTATYALKIGVSGTATSGTIKLDNVSVKEVDPNDYWTFSGDSFTFPDGAARIARTTNTTFIQQNVLTSGKLYKVEFDVLDKDDNNGTFIVRLGSNNVYDVSTYEGTRFSKYITSAGIDFRIYSSSDNGVIYVDNIVVSEVKTDTPRIDFTDNTDGHLLLEPQSTNLVTYSEDFSQGDWTKEDVLIEGGYTAPDGSSTAYKVTNNGSNAHLVGFRNINTGNHKSIWAKTVSGTGDVYLLNRSENNLFSLTNEWQRFDAAHLGLDYFYAVDFRGASATLSEVIVWGCQLEALSYPTSYIPTNGSTVTRDAETCTDAGEAIDFNSEEGVLYAEIAALANSGDFRIISLSDGTNDNRVRINYTTVSEQIQARVVVGGVTQAEINEYGFSNITDFTKIALAYKENEVKLYINGSLISTNTSASMASVNTFDRLNFNGSISNAFYGKVKAIKVYKEALSDTDLQNLTS